MARGRRAAAAARGRPRPHPGHAGRASAPRDAVVSAVASAAASRRAGPQGRLGVGPAARRSLPSPPGAARPPAAGSSAAPQRLRIEPPALSPGTRRRGARVSGGSGSTAVVEARPARQSAAVRSQCTSAGAERSEPRRAGPAPRSRAAPAPSCVNCWSPPPSRPARRSPQYKLPPHPRLPRRRRRRRRRRREGLKEGGGGAEPRAGPRRRRVSSGHGGRRHPGAAGQPRRA